MEQVERAFQQKLPKGRTVELSKKARTTPAKLWLKRKFQLGQRYEWKINAPSK